VARKSGFGFEGDPVGAGQIGGWDDARAFDKLGEFFRAGLERKPDARRLEAGHREHFSADFENQIIFPLDLFRGVGKRETDAAEPVDVHGPQNTG